MSTLRLGYHVTNDREFAGPGYFAGEAPDPAVPDSPDGRLRLVNEPARRRVVVYERSSMRGVAETLSAPDGTWRVDHLSRNVIYTVIGWDGAGVQNAAIQDLLMPALPE